MLTTPTISSGPHNLVVQYGGDSDHTPLVVQNFYVTTTTDPSGSPGSHPSSPRLHPFSTRKARLSAPSRAASSAASCSGPLRCPCRLLQAPAAATRRQFLPTPLPYVDGGWRSAARCTSIGSLIRILPTCSTPLPHTQLDAPRVRGESCENKTRARAASGDTGSACACYLCRI
ncbi:hypothetical protein B0H19DRAFT_1247528 [Mycena capillaripes]|nr:hypothetical protein B0H19DRAFT_1247528 [Mycena capillaripes]